MADYIIYISKDEMRLSLEFVNHCGIQPAEDSEDAVSNQNTSSIENDVIDIYGSKWTTKNQRYYQLGKLKDKSNNDCEPYDVTWFYTGNETYPKTKRNGKKDIFV